MKVKPQALSAELLMGYYNSLNESGQRRLLDIGENYTYVPYYQKCVVSFPAQKGGLQ